MARIGWEVLRRGGSALEAVEAAVSALEDDDAFDAGSNFDLETCILKKLFYTDKKRKSNFFSNIGKFRNGAVQSHI